MPSRALRPIQAALHQQLFAKALQRYDQDRLAMAAGPEALDDRKQAIDNFFDSIVERTVADRDHKGCFLVNTALQIDAHDDEVNAIVTNGIREIEAFFRRSIEVGQARGDIPKELDPESPAKALLALVVAIRVLGRRVFAEAGLRTIAEQGKCLVGGQQAASA